FDAQIRCGDSLIGVFSREMLREGLPDEAYKPLTGDDKELSRRYARLNKEQRERAKGHPQLFKDWSPPEILADRDHKLKEIAQDDLASVETKARGFKAIRQSDDWQRLKTASDLYISANFYMAAFFTPKAAGAAGTDGMPLTEHVWQAAGGQAPAEHLRRGAGLTSEKVGAFHWFIEFPEIMERDGGFDVVVGNPPWERFKLQEQEFFAARSPAIAGAPNKAERQKLVDALQMADPVSADGRLWLEFVFAKRTAEAASEFARSSGRYPLTGRGDVNTYALFAELFSRLAGARGRAGIIVPSGIATDLTTAPFFSSLVDQRRLVSLNDFQTGLGFFDRIGHARFKFALVTLASPGAGPAKIAFSFFSRTMEEFADDRRHFELSPSEIATINPNTRTAPVFRTHAEAKLAAKLYAHAPVLIREQLREQGGDINPWGITFQTMFHMSGDSAFFRTSGQMEDDGWSRDGTDWVRETAGDVERRVPLYQAKMIHHFDHRWATYGAVASDDEEEGARDCTLNEKQNPDFEPSPRYWVPEDEVILRAARVPSTLKSAAKLARGDDGKGRRKAGGDAQESARSTALKALITWLIGAFPALEGRPAREADIFRLLGRAQDWRGALKASPERYLLDPKTFAAGAEMQRETPLTEADLTLIAEGPKDTLTLAELLIVAKQPRWLMGWRDICRSTDERTVIASVFPRVGVGHTMPLFYLNGGAELAAAHLAMWLSLPFDFIARLSIGGTHLTYSYLKQFAALPPSAFSKDDLYFIRPRVLELTYTSHAMKAWADDLGYSGQPFAWNEDRRAGLRAELDVFFARKYGLTEEEQRYVLDPAKVKGAKYPSETFRVLKEKEIRLYGEYRTERLVLEAWKRMEKSQPDALPVSIELPPLENLLTSAWAWPASVQPRDRLRYAAQYALWQADPASDSSRMRFIIASLAEPALLTPLLAGDDRNQWVRLVGPEAQPAQGAVRLRPAINAAWHSMFEALLTSGQLEERADGTWTRGQHFSATGLQAGSADAQRAAFAIRAVRSMDVGSLAAAAAAPEDNVIWARFG
ncbi:MAG: type II DNA modification enzyme, partial [Rhizobiaceae bacterium]|nr:type II DNA modification enzyme [Rhizobiaceae bacterium]